MLIDRWLGGAVVVEHAGGRRPAEDALARIVEGGEAVETSPSVKVGVYTLENYNQFGIEVSSRTVPEPLFLPWGAVLAIADAAERDRPRTRQGGSAGQRLREGGPGRMQRKEAGPPRDRGELMDLMNDARTPAEVADAKAAADSWLSTNPSDGDVRAARERLEERQQEDEALEEGGPT